MNTNELLVYCQGRYDKIAFGVQLNPACATCKRHTLAVASIQVLEAANAKRKRKAPTQA